MGEGTGKPSNGLKTRAGTNRALAPLTPETDGAGQMRGSEGTHEQKRDTTAEDTDTHEGGKHKERNKPQVEIQNN